MNRNSTIKKVVLGGLDRTNEHKESASVLGASECINLINKEGGLRPYIAHSPFITNAITPGRDIVHIHEVNGKRYVFTHDGTNLRYEVAITDSNQKVVSSNYKILCAVPASVQILFTGKIMAIYADDTYYAILNTDDDSIDFLGKLPTMPVLSFTQTSTTATSEEKTISFPNPEGVSGYNVTGESNIDYITNASMAIINKMVADSHNRSRFIFPHFIRYGVRLFDGNYIYTSAPIMLLYTGMQDLLGTTNDFMVIQWDIDTNKIRIKYKEHALSFSLSFPDYETWKKIIVGIDIFSTSPNYSYKTDGKIESYHSITTDGGYECAFDLKYKTAFYDNMVDNTQFYLIKELNDLSASQSATLSVNEEIINNISTQTVLQEIYSLNTVKNINTVFRYNSKNHITSPTLNIFQGYSPSIFQAVKSYELDNIVAIQIVVEIDTDKGTKIAKRKETFSSPTQFMVSQWYYYPDSRATQIWALYVRNDGYITIFNEKLKKHPFLNGAYCFKVFPTSSWHTTGIDVDAVPGVPTVTASNTSETIENMLMVSATNNPFYFPVETIYRVGNGKIIGLGTPTQALSQGQFGQFPIYVFCSDGIFAGEVGASAYSSFHPVSRDIALNSKSIISIDNAIIFTSRNGLMILAGNDVQSLSAIMDGETFEFYQSQTTGTTTEIYERLKHSLKLVDPAIHDALDASAWAVTGSYVREDTKKVKRFNQMLATAEIAYDYTNKRLYIIDGDPTYPTTRKTTYVYHLGSQSFTKIMPPFSHIINSYPAAIGYDASGNLYDLNEVINHEEKIGTVPCMWLSAPMMFDETIQKLTEIKLNGFIGYNNLFACALYGSRRGDNFALIAAIDLSQHDFKIKRSGSGWKYFRILIASNMPVNSVITTMDCVFTPTLTNKLR